MGRQKGFPHLREGEIDRSTGSEFAPGVARDAIRRAHKFGDKTHGVYPTSLQEQHTIAELDRYSDRDLQPKWGLKMRRMDKLP